MSKHIKIQSQIIRNHAQFQRTAEKSLSVLHRDDAITTLDRSLGEIQRLSCNDFFHRKSSDFFTKKNINQLDFWELHGFWSSIYTIYTHHSNKIRKIHILAWITFEGSLVQGILVDQIAQSGKGKTQLCKVVVLPPKLVERWWWRWSNGMLKLKGESFLHFHVFHTMICMKNHLHNGFVWKFGAPFRIPGVAIGPTKICQVVPGKPSRRG